MLTSLQNQFGIIPGTEVIYSEDDTQKIIDKIDGIELSFMKVKGVKKDAVYFYFNDKKSDCSVTLETGKVNCTK